MRPFLRFRPWGSQALAEAPPPYSVNMWPEAQRVCHFQERCIVPLARPHSPVPPAPHGFGMGVSRRRFSSAHGRPDSSWKRTRLRGKSSGKSYALLLW